MAGKVSGTKTRQVGKRGGAYKSAMALERLKPYSRGAAASARYRKPAGVGKRKKVGIPSRFGGRVRLYDSGSKAMIKVGRSGRTKWVPARHPRGAGGRFRKV